MLFSYIRILIIKLNYQVKKTVVNNKDVAAREEEDIAKGISI